MKMRKVKVSVIITVLLVSLIFSVGFINNPVESVVTLEGVKTIAHRGASDQAPENTMSAFQKGVDYGADFIEVDVHVTKDDELVIIHDLTVNRTSNGKGKVKDLTLEEIKQLDVGSHFHADYKEERIITLNELLEELHDKVGIVIDIKYPELYIGIEEKVANIVKDYPNSQIFIQSFDFESMKKISYLLPNVEVGLLVSRKQHPISTNEWDEISEYMSYIGYNIKLLRERIVSEAHQRDLKVLTWTLKKKPQLNKAIYLGVDSIVTDYNDWFLEEHVLIENPL
ncbi:glycerophosphodiester phosphodiesterase family protein [Gracilibacillus sp. YIM 98692]|uniref:glycerophosphodiester phosphodiesterase n=1 Tax=Gracilibacillus sp. YIM 98692 TaxID=2663532 RepID=UPI0013D7E186|nr:glycerophosphodiester phosphodiesterase family protein [Gracilibacillus sp. YIM 98692]